MTDDLVRLLQEENASLRAALKALRYYLVEYTEHRCSNVVHQSLRVPARDAWQAVATREEPW